MMHALKHTDQSEIVVVGSETTTTGLLASHPPCTDNSWFLSRIIGTPLAAFQRRQPAAQCPACPTAASRAY
jgi:hypothetical protein